MVVRDCMYSKESLPGYKIRMVRRLAVVGAGSSDPAGKTALAGGSRPTIVIADAPSAGTPPAPDRSSPKNGAPRGCRRHEVVDDGWEDRIIAALLGLAGGSARNILIVLSCVQETGSAALAGIFAQSLCRSSFIPIRCWLVARFLACEKEICGVITSLPKCRGTAKRCAVFFVCHQGPPKVKRSSWQYKEKLRAIVWNCLFQGALTGR